MTEPSGQSSLLELAHGRVREARKWYRINQGIYFWLTTVGWCAGALVPFGLGLDLYVRDLDLQRRISLWLLGGSALSFGCLMLASVMRYRERADVQRSVYERLDLAIAAFRDGALDLVGLHVALKDSISASEDESNP